MGGKWRELRLGELVARGALAITDGYRVRNVELGPAGIPFVRGGDIGDGWIRTDTVDHVRPELADRVRARLAHAGDVVFISYPFVSPPSQVLSHLMGSFDLLTQRIEDAVERAGIGRNRMFIPILSY